ncbi:hypothetical protein GGI35DRAFT_78848 [Trichoderma velutinum]
MFTGIYGVCEGDAYVEAPVSALLLSIWRHCRGFLLFFFFLNYTLLFSVFLSQLYVLIPCNFLLLFLFFFSLWAMVIVWSI